MDSWEKRSKRRYHVEILRVDGTAWAVPELAKHVLHKDGGKCLEIYLREHDEGRQLLLVPYERIDHVYVTEVNDAKQSDKHD